VLVDEGVGAGEVEVVHALGRRGRAGGGRRRGPRRR
jgi:hypothetical protein